MSITLVRKSQIRPLNIIRSDINTTTSGSALITKVIAGTGLSLSSSTGVNPGTGDVTIALSIATASVLGGVKIGSGLTVAVDGTISVTSVSTTWGSVTGTLSNQTDLQAALNAKYNNPTGTSSQYIDGTGAYQTFPSTINYANTSGTSTNTYRAIVEDTRVAERTPNEYDDYRVSWEFTNQIQGVNLGASTWWSAMTTQGWHDGYAAWQIIGPASSAIDDFYLRSGVDDIWNTSRRIWHNGDFTSTNVSNWNTAYSWGNHAIQSYATQTYVNNAIANLVDSAPGTLDTLNELAAALGDDPNFATTVTNSIATKLPLAGGTMTGNLNINTSTNFPLLLTGTNANYTAIGIRNTGTGDAGIYMDGINGDFGGSDYAFIGQKDEGYLLYNIGASSPLPYHVFTGGNVGIGTTSPSAKLEIAGFSTGAGLKLNYGNSSGTIEAVNFIANGGANGVIGMQMVSAGVGDLWLGGSGGRSLTLYRDGKVGIGTTAPAEEFHVLGRAIFDGGSGNSSTDAVVYITKSTNDDWGLYVNNAGLDYGTYTRVSPSANYAFAIHNGTTWTTRITGNAIIYLGEKNAIEGNYDSWLRLNNSSQYASGVYTPGVMRADGGFNVSGSTVWHAGNDGSGSGLDADTVDGVQADNIVYGNARGTNDSVTTDADGLDKTGFYTSGEFVTRPESVDNWMYIQHIKLYNSNTGYQKQIGYDTYDDRMWVRTKNSNTWSSWKQIWTSDSLTNLSQLTNGPGYITSYTETDTLNSVTGRGATTSNTIQVGKLGIGRAAASNESISVENPEGRWLIQGFRSDVSVGGLHTNDGILHVQAASVRIQASSSATWNGDTLATRPWVIAQGYITGYTETDTLASVTGRGATTNTASVFRGGLYGQKAQVAGDYTSAALWTESYDNTATGIAFHISGNVGKFLEMRTDGILYWEDRQVWTSGNLTSLSQLANDPGYLTSLPSHNHDDRYLVKGGSWYGAGLPGSRWGGFSVDGGEIVFGNGLPNAGQMGMLIDGAYLAGENNGFWSLPSDNTWSGRRGMSWNGTYLDFTTNSPTAQFTNLRLANGFEIQQGGSNYGRFNSWVHLNGHYGFYSDLNGAHIYPNDGSYGSWKIAGSRNDYRGLQFSSGVNGDVSLMIHVNSNITGFHNASYDWQFYWSAGTLYCFKDNYGGGTQATVLDSVNYTDYAATSGHTHDLMRYSLRAPGNVDSLTASNFRDQLFGTSANGWTTSTARWNTTPSGLSGMNSYGTMFAWSGSDTHGFIATDYSTANIQVGGGNANLINWKVTLIHNLNIGSYALTSYTETDTLQSVTSRGASTNTGIYINNNNPTLYLQDTDHRSAMIHVNSNYFYILNGAGTNSDGWAQQANSRWLFMGNLNNNDITFGGSGDFAGTVTASGGNSSQWNTAYSWGNHAGLYASISHTHIIDPISETDVPPAGISIQAGPGSGNAQGWAHPYGTRLSAIVGGGRSFEIMSTTYPNGELVMRTLDGPNIWDEWKIMLDANNYSSYAATRTGGNTSGTWPISITGNADSATTATTAGALSSMNISQFTNDSGYITSSALGSYLPLAGGTMTGNLTLGGGTNILFTGGSHAIAGNNTGYLHFYDYTDVYFNNQLVIRGGIRNDNGNVLIDDNLNVAGELAFRDGAGVYSNIIRAAAYPSEGYPDGLNYWLEYQSKGGHHFVLNTDGGVGGGANTMDDFIVWQGAIDGDRLLELSNLGDLTISGRYTEQSSLRYKENIINLESITEKVDRLRPVRYNKIGNTNTEIGLIAEEVAEVFPEFVNYNADGEAESLNYTRLSVVLLQTVKELSDKINKLETK